MTTEIGYTIRTMAARCSVTVYTLRYYERVGLIQAVKRGGNGHRRYSDTDEAWVKFLHSLRATQMPIREMRRYTALRPNGVDGVREQRKILEEHRTRLEHQIAKLSKAIAVLAAHFELLQAEEQSTSPYASPLSRKEEQNPYVSHGGKLLDSETGRLSIFAAETEPQA